MTETRILDRYPLRRCPDSAPVPLSDGTVGDPHYTIISVPSGTTATRVARLSGGYPIPPYLGDDALSAWIGPNNDSDLDGPVGHYVYRTTFDLTGFNSATAMISGGWSSDNDGVSILLNSVNTGNPATSFTQFSTGFAPFTITSGFLSGLNTLDFVINNGGGPTALRVEMRGNADAVAPVPEPATMLLLGSGLVGLAGFGRKKLLKIQEQ